MAASINVKFNANNEVYFPGQQITGCVILNSNKELTARSINVTFKGYSKVSWEQFVPNDEGPSETLYYSNSEEYYKAKYSIWGEGCSHDKLPPGTHKFNFSYLLPINIPSSYRSDIGKVQHELEVMIDVPIGKDIKKIIPYSVNNIYDLNKDQNALVEIEENGYKSFCCLCCCRGPVSLMLRVPSSGYVPGEAILINAECTNMSNKLVNYSNARIMQNVIYHAAVGKKKISNHMVAMKEHPKIKSGESDIWSCERLLVPALPPSYLLHCSIIDITYSIKFSVNVKDTMGSVDLSVEAPLIIGSIPLRRQCFKNNSPAAELPQSNTTIPDEPPAYSSIPTPPLPHKDKSGPSMSLPCFDGLVQEIPEGFLPLPLPHKDRSGPSMSLPCFDGLVQEIPEGFLPPAYDDANCSPSLSEISEIKTSIASSAPVSPVVQEYPDMTPPTSSQSVFGLTKHEVDEDDFEYIPRYVSYGLKNT